MEALKGYFIISVLYFVIYPLVVVGFIAAAYWLVRLAVFVGLIA